MIQVKTEWVRDWKARVRRLMHENLEGYGLSFRQWIFSGMIIVYMHMHYPYKSIDIDIDIEINSWPFAYLIGVTLSRAMSRVKTCGCVASRHVRIRFRWIELKIARNLSGYVEDLRMIEKRESISYQWVMRWQTTIAMREREGGIILINIIDWNLKWIEPRVNWWRIYGSPFIPYIRFFSCVFTVQEMAWSEKLEQQEKLFFGLVWSVEVERAFA